MSNLQRRLVMSQLPPAMPPPGKGMTGVGTKKGFLAAKRDYTPVSWDNYLEKMSDVKVENDTFRVYENGSSGPVCFCLHGGGFSALSWAVFSKTLTGLVSCRCIAVDLRGHGDTVTEDCTDLTADVMANDVERVICKLFGDSPPPIILIGHSMGGAIAVRTACRNKLTTLTGLIVIDVVEGTALEALSSMQTFLRARPKTFPSIEKAIEYCVRSGQIRNVESARVSVVGQLKRTETNETATAEIEHQLHPIESLRNDDIQEEDDEASPSPVKTLHPASSPRLIASNATGTASVSYSWRIDLSSTEQFWRGWFEGLSKSFLSCSAPKMLLLAGVDRLDKDLTIGQMQGKFQMQLLPQSGHAVHEDSPEKVADAIATFLVRNRLTIATESFPSAFPGS